MHGGARAVVFEPGDVGAGVQFELTGVTQRPKALVGRQDAGPRLEEGRARQGDAGKACLGLLPGQGFHCVFVVRQCAGHRLDQLGVAEAQLPRDVEETPAALLLELAPEGTGGARHRDIVRFRVAEAEDARIALRSGEWVADAVGGLEHVDGPASP